MLNIIFMASYDPLLTGNFILILSVVLIVSIILSFVFRGKEKKDEGFVFVYHKLSYRRKFIRSIWTLTIAFTLLFFAFRIANISPITEIIVYVIGAIGAAIQIMYNYKMWKKHEDKNLEE